jgi:hypothetical protein
MLLRLKSVSHVVARMIELDALFPLHGTSLDPTSTRMVLHNQLLLTALITKLTTRKPKNPIHQSRGRSGSSMADLDLKAGQAYFLSHLIFLLLHSEQLFTTLRLVACGFFSFLPRLCTSSSSSSYTLAPSPRSTSEDMDKRWFEPGSSLSP